MKAMMLLQQETRDNKMSTIPVLSTTKRQFPKLLVSVVLLCIAMVVCAFTTTSTVLVQGVDNRRSLTGYAITLQSHDFQFRKNETTAPAVPSDYKIAFVVVAAFVRCSAKGGKATGQYAMDGMAVLSESIRQHYPNATLILLAHPSTKACGIEQLADYGYQIDYRDHPVPMEEIENQDFLQIARFERPGCCGMREFMKLHCYTLTDYDVVIQLDHDTLLKKDVNDLIRVMMGEEPQKWIPTYRNEGVPKEVDFIFTRDYKGGNLLHPDDPHRIGMQGGFFMVKPNMEVYKEMQQILKRGNFGLANGWEESGIGQFYGDAQIQGFLAYYYYIHTDRALEVDRCIYNTVMEDDYLREDGTCMTNETTCQDCRETPWEDLSVIHYTMCTKPWTCMLPTYREGDYHLCKQAHREWFRVRRDLEQRMTGEVVSLGGDDWTYGYCSEYGYLDMNKNTYIRPLVAMQYS